MSVVRVIVDVPAREVNRPFDYAVPAHLQPWIQIGCRVVVPFGARTVQGFVVGESEESGRSIDELKPVVRLLDLEPPLTPELVQLSDWISRKYVCSRIVVLQAMLPAALKAKYKRTITVASAPASRLSSHDMAMKEIVATVEEAGSIDAEQLLARFRNEADRIRQLLNSGVLIEHRHVRDRIGKKKQLTVFPNSREQMERVLSEIGNRAVRQQEVLRNLLDDPQPIALQELARKLQVSTGTIKSLAEKGAFRLEAAEVLRDPYEHRRFERSEPLPLTQDQSAACAAIEQSIHKNEFRRFLLHGVTGSGKTEIYLQTIRTCIEAGRESIVLVPEISLTPQMVERFKGRFGDQVAVLHSRLSHGERYDEWRKIKEGRAMVAIGARSAVFAPFRRLGLIVIDEEHESSYKQEDAPKYHARDVAFARGKFHRAAVVLGSATPSLESYSQAGGSLHYLHLPVRVAGRQMPEVDIVDMRDELKAGNRSMFSRTLFRSLEETLKRGEQTVLLLNRRGHSTFVMCRSCGHTAQCPHCEIALTYHRTSRNVRCHYCGYARPELQTCPDCGSGHIRYFGTGTQKVEEELARLIPGIRVIRMDVDTTMEKGAHEKWLDLFRRKQADVLLGTQMVAKGLDFPDVTLVGVIAADTVLHLPDFRASEKTFQLLTQVAGRAGRHELPGRVVIQSYNPDHYSIVHAGKHDYIPFADTELELRKKRLYPPYCSLALITFMHEHIPLLMKAGEQFVHRFKTGWHKSDHGRTNVLLDVMGPVASPISRRKDRYRFQCVVKYRKDPRIPEWIREVTEQLALEYRRERLQISVDVDPQVMM